MTCYEREQVLFRLMDVTRIGCNFVQQSMACIHDIDVAQLGLTFFRLHTREETSFSRCKHAGGAGSRES
jgi:hypothetical protein